MIERFNQEQWGDDRACPACLASVLPDTAVLHLTLRSDAPYLQRHHFVHVTCLKDYIARWESSDGSAGAFEEMRQKMIEAGSLIYE